MMCSPVAPDCSQTGHWRPTAACGGQSKRREQRAIVLMKLTLAAPACWCQRGCFQSSSGWLHMV